MNIIDFKMQDQSFSGTVVNGKKRYSMKGSFKTSHQDYPGEKDAPLYASTVFFDLIDAQGKKYEVPEHENQVIEEILNDKIDEILEANPKMYIK